MSVEIWARMLDESLLPSMFQRGLLEALWKGGTLQKLSHSMLRLSIDNLFRF